MPLSAAYPLMEQAITDAYMTLLAEGQKDGADAEKLMKDLAKALAKAVHDYTMSAQVITTTNGVIVGTAAPLAPTGAAPVFGTSTGAGNGNLA